MDEFQIIRRYFDVAVTDPDIRKGIGDDAAIVRAAPGRDLLAAVDTMVEGIHFPKTLAAEHIGYRAVAVNLSDIAAMGGRPRWMTLALTMTESNPAWLADFSRGLFDAAQEFDVALVGGDTTAGSQLVISIQVLGDVEPNHAMTRATAREGDSIYVSGTLGDASAGLAYLQSGATRNDDANFLVRRFNRPDARVQLGQALASLATAAIDLSDGLYTDVEKLLSASNVAGVIELENIPLSTALQNVMDRNDAMQYALGGGDDYELCFTSAAPAAEIRELAASSNVPLTRIGTVAEGSGLRCSKNGADYEFRDAGYRHFH